MKIGDLAKKTGCKAVTIRYYEKEGFLPKPNRSEGNYRMYTKEDQNQLEFIVHCRKHNIKPDAIRKLLAFRNTPQQDCTWVSDLIEIHLANVEQQISSLQHLKQHLVELGKRCSGGNNGETCGIMQTLEDPSLCCTSCGRRGCK